ncbi:MAG: sulfite exporter TauE/SafE family protein [Chitinophagaceae bacterium]|nr:sulfite exporter TauE/SafE family protein [Chitinophagaceae bacterium]
MSIIEIISAAFLMGLVGSLHCVGMCGPLALALPVSHANDGNRLLGGLVYNSGRIITYGVMGVVLGLAGQFLLPVTWLQTLSIVFGVIILLYLFLPVKRITSSVSFLSSLNKPFLALRQAMGKLFTRQKFSSLFSIGLLNGLLPCGLVYLAISSSFITGNAWKGGMFMLFFGLGTLPLMLATVFFGSYMNQQIRSRLRRAVPVFLFVMAALLILRGMGLGIPYVSPAFHQPEAVGCH